MKTVLLAVLLVLVSVLAGVGVGALGERIANQKLRATPAQLAAAQRVVRLQRDLQDGHACPVEGVGLLTARHMMDGDRGLGWSQPDGPRGWLNPRGWAVHASMDAARTALPDGILTLPAGPDARVGDVVVIVGINFNHGFARRIVVVRVVTADGWEIMTDATPGPGSSGSCVIDAEGRVAAISNASTQRGQGVGVQLSAIR